MNRARIRDLGITIGRLPIGPYNAITDIPGVLVGQVSLVQEQPKVARTGITVIVPRDGAIGRDYAFAGFHRFNGCGEMTGIHWLEETGLLTSAITLTNTLQIGMVHDALSEYSWSQENTGPFYLPVVAETYDGWLNDMSWLPITRDHVFSAMANAKSGPVDEGNVGGGTGMISYEFKGGIGTSSRLVEVSGKTFTVGALVQANHGDRDQLRVDGVPIGRELNIDRIPSPWIDPPPSSSIIIILATDAPFLSDQCRRLAHRATLGLARTGANGHNSSGDLFLAFATGQHIPAQTDDLIHLEPMIPDRVINPFFDAAAEAAEEAILNALAAAETLVGVGGHTAYALPLDEVRKIMAQYRKKAE